MNIKSKTAAYLSLSLLIIILSGILISFTADQYQQQREQMVRTQLQNRGITDQKTLEAMRKTERHKFIPGSQQRQAYEDRPLPIGYGQTISQPYIVAYMTQIIEPKSHYRVLEIGTGSGYQAAVLAEIVDEVYTIEIIEELGNHAIEVLDKLNYNNAHVKIADGYYGWEEYAPFDAIVVTAAAEHIPPPLVKQLKDGGKMIIPVGSPFRVQQLMLVEKKNDQLTTKNLMPVRFVPFRRADD